MSRQRQGADRSASLPIAAAAFASIATATSVSVSVIAAWERGGQPDERLVWVGIGLVVMLSAHLLPALCRGAPVTIRCVALLLWVVSMAATAYGHATFFISAQQHAGAVRAAAIVSPAAAVEPPPTHTRSLTEIAGERLRVLHDIELAKARTCIDACTGSRVVLKSPKARLDALDIEAREVRRTQRHEDRLIRIQDHLAEARDAAAVDPVTGRIGKMFSTSAARVNLVIGLGFGLLLESLACVGWLLALTGRSRAEQTVTAGSRGSADSASGRSPAYSLFPSVNPTTSTGNGLEAVRHQAGNRAVTDSNGNGPSTPHFASHRGGVTGTEAGPDLARFAAEIAAGRARATVSDIRKFFRCSQQRAMELRRQFSSAMLDLARTD